MPVKSFRDLDAWRVAMDLALSVYSIAAKLPAHERFEMASQMRRAALSVPSNIAEGFSTKLRRRSRHHVRISLGSVAELVTCLELGRRLGYWDPVTVAQMNKDLDRVGQLLSGVLRGIKRQEAAEAGTGLALIIGCLLML